MSGDTSLSILIPVYNFYVFQLIDDIYRQAASLNIAFEIRVYDDGSDAEYVDENKQIRDIGDQVVYKPLNQNYGRVRIRNLLAEEARYANLLFLDCDVKIVTPDYLHTYLPFLNSEYVIEGGRCYHDSPPRQAHQYLHWYIGINKEALSARQRSVHPYQSFYIDNMLIARHIFLNIKLDEKIRGYGHEDTLFGQKLKEKNIKVIHIDNAVEHIGINDAEAYLSKTFKAVDNLFFLYRTDHFGEDTGLVKTFITLKKLGIAKMFLHLISAWHDQIVRRLCYKPSLFLFDMLKLERFLQNYYDKKTASESEPFKATGKSGQA